VSIKASVVEPVTNFATPDPFSKEEEQGNGDEYSNQK
jgi:hypothetical protein